MTQQNFSDRSHPRFASAAIRRRPAIALLALAALVIALTPAHAGTTWEASDDTGLVRLEFGRPGEDAARELAAIARRPGLTLARLIVENRRPDGWIYVDTAAFVTLTARDGHTHRNAELAWPLFWALRRGDQYLFESGPVRPGGSRVWWVGFDGPLPPEAIMRVSVTVEGKEIALERR